MKPRQNQRRIRMNTTAPKSYFTETKTLPDYKQADVLKQFMTERGKILPRSRTGLSMKQQRLLTIAIKRARHLAKLPFVSQVG